MVAGGKLTSRPTMGTGGLLGPIEAKKLVAEKGNVLDARINTGYNEMTRELDTKAGRHGVSTALRTNTINAFQGMVDNMNERKEGMIYRQGRSNQRTVRRHLGAKRYNAYLEENS